LIQAVGLLPPIVDDPFVCGGIAAASAMSKIYASGGEVTGVTACTDIADFGLLGHAIQLAERSGVRLRIALETIPFPSGALEYAELGFIPASVVQSRDHFAAHGDDHVG